MYNIGILLDCKKLPIKADFRIIIYTLFLSGIRNMNLTHFLRQCSFIFVSQFLSNNNKAIIFQWERKEISCGSIEATGQDENCSWQVEWHDITRILETTWYDFS